MTNPLLSSHLLPSFADIKPEHIEPALDQLMVKNRARISQLLKQEPNSATQWLRSLEEWDDQLQQLWSPVSHLNGVKNSDELRDVYNICLPKLTEYATEMGQNKNLYKAYKKLADSEDYKHLSLAEQKSVNNALRDFTLSGIALDDDKQQRFGAIKKQLASLTTQFSNNVLDATHGWSKHVVEVKQLLGIPDNTVQAYQQAAKEKGLEGYLISLDIPSYLPLLQYCDDSALREEMYTAYVTRASELGPNAGEWNNSQLMIDILKLRQELAKLLGYNTYAERSLATKMADSPRQVEQFLIDLAEKSLPVAKRDYAELLSFAKSQGTDQLKAWDVPYYSEKLRLEKYSLSQEELRAYFPADKVIAGMFDIVNRLFSVEFVEVNDVDKWHDDVRFYHVLRNGEVIAKFYLDIFARKHKRGGAWMADCRVRRKLANGQVQQPVAFLTCNFTSPTATTPSLLTHNEVTTLFHEFGHGLHHMLTEIECAAVSGINGVAWDAVELPSQFLENWCWEKQALELISGHYKTGEILPEALLEKMLAAKNFQSGMMMMRQLEFALFDMRIHSHASSEPLPDIQLMLNQIRQQWSVSKVPEFNRFQHSFSHIFAGGYAAGYYSYKWAELLSADAYSRFEEEGEFNQQTGHSFLTEILQRGGSEEPMQLFTNFRGRPPSVDALLRHSGIISDEVAV